MAAKLITLERWALENYGEAAPHINTLRRWARDALIAPVPQKHGRTYYVRPDARYEDFRHVAVVVPAKSGTGPRLVDRIR